MKNKILLFVCCCLIFLCNISYSQSGWVWQNPAPTGKDLKCSFALNSSTYFVGGIGGTILKSTNSGTNWNTIKFADSNDVIDIYFINNSTGWIIGGKSIYKTSDAGNTWISCVYNANSFSFLSFVDENTGYAHSGNHLLYKTTNGGLNWTTFSLPSSGVSFLKFFNNLSGIYISTTSLVYKTTDGGDNWISLYDQTGTTFTGDFINENTGWFAKLNMTTQEILKTTNGGVSCTSILFNNYYILKIKFYDGLNGYLTEANDSIYSTTNGGSTWISRKVYSNTQYSSIAAGESNSALITSKRGIIIKTTNSGNNWRDMRSFFTENNISSVNFNNLSTGFVTADSGKAYKTTDGGNTWQGLLLQPASNSENLLSSFFVDENTGFIGGTSSFLYKTTNSGINWSYQSNLAYNIKRIFFLNAQTGWISGDNLNKTTNGGTNWITENSPFTNGAGDVWFLNTSTGFVTTSYNLSFTTNAGANWYLSFAEPNPYNIRYIYFINQNTGWLTGNKTFLKTTNSGLSWNQNLINSYLAYSRIQYVNTNTGYCIAYVPDVSPNNYLLYKTTNQGVNWSSSSPSFQFGISNLDFVNENTGWISGQNGAILKTTTGGNVFISQISIEIPEKYSLHQNYPNPFNPTTNIKFDIHKQGIATLKVYDLLGKEMETLVDEQLSVGTYEVTFNAGSLPSGIYFYVLKTGDFVESKKMILVK